MDMSPPAPTFDPRLGYRDAIVVLTFLGAIAGGIYALGQQSKQNEALVAQMRQEFEFRMITMEKLSIQYVPVIQGLEKSDGRQEDRIQGMSAAIGDIRKTNGELLSQMSRVREDVAGMKAIIDNRAIR